MALVDTLEEQALLEQLIDGSKPAVPAECRSHHYLLSTPFRYGAPYPAGSRFRRAGLTPGVFYASTALPVAIAEMAFRRLLFFAESPATPWPRNAVEHTAFSVRYSTRAGLDLTSPPLDRHITQWTEPVAYEKCQALADAAREAGTQVLRYRSARADGVNQNLTRVESDETHLARFAHILKREQHADRRRFVRRKDTLQVTAEAVEQVFRCTLGRLTRRPRILIRRDNRDGGKPRLEPC